MARMKRAGLATLIGMVLVMTSCSSLRPLSSSRILDNYEVKNLVIVVPDSFVFTPGLVTHTLPAGTYTPAFEDDEGIYFQSPGKILIGDVFGPTLHDGGLFFKGGTSGEVYEYVIVGHRHSNWKLPGDFKFKIEKKP